MPLDKIPWEILETPEVLSELIKTKQISGGTALDIAYGTGNYSFYLARHGFDVIGVDFSDKALEIARKNNMEMNLSVSFKFADAVVFGACVYQRDRHAQAISSFADSI